MGAFSARRVRLRWQSARDGGDLPGERLEEFRIDGRGPENRLSSTLWQLKTDSGVAFVFELEYNKKGKVHGEVCVLHEDEDGDLVPLSVENAKDHITEEDETEKMLLN